MIFRDSRRAFTIIEVVLCLVLVCLIFGLSMPALSRFFQTESFSQSIESFMSFARYHQHKSIYDKNVLRARIDVKNKTCTIEHKNEDNVFVASDDTREIFSFNKETQLQLLGASWVLFFSDGKATKMQIRASEAGEHAEIRFGPTIYDTQVTYAKK